MKIEKKKGGVGQTWDAIKYDNNREGHSGGSSSCSTLSTWPLFNSSLHHIYYAFKKKSMGQHKRIYGGGGV